MIQSFTPTYTPHGCIIKSYQEKGPVIMQKRPDFNHFYEHDIIKKLAKNEKWTVSDKDKIPIDLKLWIYQQKLCGAQFNNDLSLVTLDVLRKEIPNAANHAYYLDAMIDKYVVLDIEPSCPDDIKQELLQMSYSYGERSMSGKGYHLIFPLPTCIAEYPIAQTKLVLKEEHGYYEILMAHYVTFTADMLPPASGTEPFEPLFRKLASQQKEVVRTEMDITEMAPEMDTCTLRIQTALKFCGHCYPKHLEDFHNDHSKYEFAYMMHLYKNLQKLIQMDSVQTHRTYTESEQAWFLYSLAKEQLPHRVKHEETRDGLPWLVYLAREVMAKYEDPKEKQKNKKG